MLLVKVCLTKNKDLQGTLQKLNSRYVKDGITTYEMALEEQELDSENENYEKLPGTRKLDVIIGLNVDFVDQDEAGGGREEDCGAQLQGDCGQHFVRGAADIAAVL